MISSDKLPYLLVLPAHLGDIAQVPDKILTQARATLGTTALGLRPRPTQQLVPREACAAPASTVQRGAPLKFLALVGSTAKTRLWRLHPETARGVTTARLAPLSPRR